MWEKGFDFPLKNFVDIFPRFYKRKNMAYKKNKKGGFRISEKSFIKKQYGPKER